MAAVLGAFTRAYVQFSGTLTASPRAATSSVSQTLWGWWDNDVTHRASSTAQSVAVKSAIAAAAVRRIANAVAVQSTGAVVAKATAALDSDPTGAASAPSTPPRRGSARGWGCSPCTSWSFFCQRRSRSTLRHGGSHLYAAPDAESEGRVVVEEIGEDAEGEGGATNTTTLDAGARANGRGEEQLVVYLKKRPVYGTDWAHTLTRLGQDHVGVVVAPLSEVRQCGGSVPSTLDGPGAGTVTTQGSVSFDFGPVDGKDFSIFKICSAEIRRNKFEDGHSALVATTSRSLEEIEQFNAQYGATYHLGVSDCRDYAAALVRFLTGVRIRPSDLSHYITSCNSHEGIEDEGGDASTHATNTASSSDVAAAAGRAQSRRTPRFCLELSDMYSMVSGAPAPFHLRLGL